MRTRRRGLTIIECLLATTILAFATLVISYTLVAAEAQAQAGDSMAKATRLARDLLEEIVAKPYEDPTAPGGFGPEAGETGRAVFDDVDDYDGYAESPGQVRDATGALYDPAYQTFGRAVSVTAQSRSIGDFNRTYAGLLVMVTIREEGRGEWRFTRFIPRPTKP